MQQSEVKFRGVQTCGLQRFRSEEDCTARSSNKTAAPVDQVGCVLLCEGEAALPDLGGELSVVFDALHLLGQLPVQVSEAARLVDVHLSVIRHHLDPTRVLTCNASDSIDMFWFFSQTKIKSCLLDFSCYRTGATCQHLELAEQVQSACWILRVLLLTKIWLVATTYLHLWSRSSRRFSATWLEREAISGRHFSP